MPSRMPSSKPSPTKMEPILKLQGVNLQFGGNNVLTNITLEILPHEMVSLIGLNGSGKTSLLKIMLGVYKPTSGQIINRAKRIGYVPQKFEFDRTNPFSVKELLRTYNRVSETVIRKKLQEVDAEDLIDKPFGALSGGQMQRVLIANALLNNPELLLLDEPTSGLDVAGEKDFYCLIEQIHKKYRIAIVIVSHDVHMVFNQAQKILCVDHGVVCHGHPEEMKKNKEFVRLFGPHLIPFKHHNHNADHS